MSELKPCPFCGGTGSLYHCGLEKSVVFVSCDVCGS